MSNDPITDRYAHMFDEMGKGSLDGRTSIRRPGNPAGEEWLAYVQYQNWCECRFRVAQSFEFFLENRAEIECRQAFWDASNRNAVLTSNMLHNAVAKALKNDAEREAEKALQNALQKPSLMAQLRGLVARAKEAAKRALT